LFELVDVSMRYGDVQALDRVSLKVNRGEVLTLLGPNGSGKTTFLRVTAGLERPSKGRVLFDGTTVDESNMVSVRRSVTMVFQQSVVLKRAVYDNVAYGLKLRGINSEEVKRRVEGALKLVRLGHLSDRSARALSGGEQQRLSLARAIALDCEVVLLDEPTANLDPESLIIVKDVIRRLNREKGTTIIIATHNLEQAEDLSDRIVLLRDGRVVEEARPEELFVEPSAAMARFTRSENVFSGVSRIVDGVAHVSIGEGVEIMAAFGHEGQVLVNVRPEDIIISRSRMESSARNNLLGRISSITEQNSIVKLKVDVGRLVTVQITRKSLVEMGLNVGQEIYLTFKASSVQAI
jgi:tungstate transport system ATP-binding protein